MRQALGLFSGATDFWLRLISLLLLVALWAIVANIVQDPRTLPGPWPVAVVMYEQTVSGDLLYHVGVTLRRVFFSFVIAMAIGTAIGIIMGRSRALNVLFDGWLVLGLNIPALVVIVLCYIWFNLTEVAAITAVAINKIPTVVVTVREGARAIDRDLLQVAEVYRLSWRKRMFTVVMPQLYPYLMAAARGGLALIWKIVLVVELLGRQDGVGFQLYTFFQFFDITSILAYTLAFVAVVMAFELVVLRPLEKKMTGWRL